MSEQRFADFSKDRKYRYSLHVEWGDRPRLVAIGLNPSIADEARDDPTIRRLKQYAKDWGYGGLIMLNLFGLVSTNREGLKKVEDPVGLVNSIAFMRSHIRNVGQTWALACWGSGVYPKIHNREQLVYDSLRLKCLKVNKDGSPAHPLYLKGTLTPKPYNYKDAE